MQNILSKLLLPWRKPVPKIPFGYAQVFGQSQKGDGRWNGRRFAKVKKEYPKIESEDVVIRRLKVEQPDLIHVAHDNTVSGTPTGIEIEAKQ